MEEATQNQINLSSATINEPSFRKQQKASKIKRSGAITSSNKTASITGRKMSPLDTDRINGQPSTKRAQSVKRFFPNASRIYVEFLRFRGTFET